jgi:hypothetical protein
MSAHAVEARNTSCKASKYTRWAISWTSGSRELSAVMEWRIEVMIFWAIFLSQPSLSLLNSEFPFDKNGAMGRERLEGAREEYHFQFIWYSGQCPGQSGREDVLNYRWCGCDAPDATHGAEKVDRWGWDCLFCKMVGKLFTFPSSMPRVLGTYEIVGMLRCWWRACLGRQFLGRGLLI